MPSNTKFAELVGRALLLPDFRKSLLADPDGVLAGTDISDEQKKLLVEGLKANDPDKIKVSDLPDIFGARFAGVGGGVM